MAVSKDETGAIPKGHTVEIGPLHMGNELLLKNEVCLVKIPLCKSHQTIDYFSTPPRGDLSRECRGAMMMVDKLIQQAPPHHGRNTQRAHGGIGPLHSGNELPDEKVKDHHCARGAEVG